MIPWGPMAQLIRPHGPHRAHGTTIMAWTVIWAIWGSSFVILLSWVFVVLARICLPGEWLCSTCADLQCLCSSLAAALLLWGSCHCFELWIIIGFLYIIRFVRRPALGGKYVFDKHAKQRSMYSLCVYRNSSEHAFKTGKKFGVLFQRLYSGFAVPVRFCGVPRCLSAGRRTPEASETSKPTTETMNIWYIYIYIYICTYVLMYLCIHIYIHMYLCIHIYIYTYTYIYRERERKRYVFLVLHMSLDLQHRCKSKSHQSGHSQPQQVEPSDSESD